MDSQLVATQEEIFREHSREPGVSPHCVWMQQAGSADGILLLVVASARTYKNVSPQQKRGTSSGDDIVFGGHYQQGAVRASARADREIGMCFTASSRPGLEARGRTGLTKTPDSGGSRQLRDIGRVEATPDRILVNKNTFKYSELRKDGQAP